MDLIINYISKTFTQSVDLILRSPMINSAARATMRHIESSQCLHITCRPTGSPDTGERPIGTLTAGYPRRFVMKTFDSIRTAAVLSLTPLS